MDWNKDVYNEDGVLVYKARKPRDSRREQFAMAAMQGLMSSQAAYDATFQGCSAAIAEKSVELADVLIAALDKGVKWTSV